MGNYSKHCLSDDPLHPVGLEPVCLDPVCLEPVYLDLVCLEMSLVLRCQQHEDHRRGLESTCAGRLPADTDRDKGMQGLRTIQKDLKQVWTNLKQV